MMFTSENLASAVARLAASMPALEQELNRADAKLGDGDTGSMLSRVVSAMAAVDIQGMDVGAALSAYAKATAKATGSSLGTLIATGLLAGAKLTKGETAVEWTVLSSILEAARDAMLARGGANLGDKTVLDGLDAIAAAIKGVDNSEDMTGAAVAAARDALDRFRDQPNRIGRARMFEEGSKGLDDPGMLAVARLTEIVGSR